MLHYQTPGYTQYPSCVIRHMVTFRATRLRYCTPDCTQLLGFISDTRLNPELPDSIVRHPVALKANSQIACRAHTAPMTFPCHAVPLMCLSHLIYTVRPCLIHTCHRHCTARPSRDGLWATCPRSTSSGYHAEFHEDCYQKHTSPPHNDPYIRL